MRTAWISRASVLCTVGFLTGCAVPPAGKNKGKVAKQEDPAPVLEPAATEAVEAPKQDTLSAIEDFLARTQDYRAPMREDAVVSAVPASIAPDATPAKTESAIHTTVTPAARDAAYANAQISISDTTPPAAPPIAVPALESVSIRPATTTTARADDHRSKVKVTNGPVELQSKVKSDSADALVESLRDEMGRKSEPATVWKLRTLLTLLERDAEAAVLGSDLSGEQAEVIRAWNEATVAVRNYVRNPSQGPDAAIANVGALRDVLNAKSEPRVRSVAMCRRVVTFGSYEEIAAEELVSGRSIQTIVYAEIENLRTRDMGSGSYETKLATRLEVLTSDGKSMWQREEPEVVDKCRRPRRDFFVAQRVTLPPTLPVGEYVLKFSVEDKMSGQIAESSVSFGIRSPVSVANGQ